MIEVKNRFHTARYLANVVRWQDAFSIVRYCAYRGDLRHVPWWFSMCTGESCWTDLSLSLEEILKQMKSNSRNEIRRAEKEGISFALVTDRNEFITYYNSFCEAKKFDDRVTISRLSAYKNLLITKAVCAGITLAMHVTMYEPKDGDSMLLFSCSQRLDDGVNRKLIGWGNRYLHYKDIEFLKRKGMHYYDWNGICSDENDARYSIGQFKLSMGGVQYQSVQLKSPLYVLATVVKTVLCKIRECCQ